MPTVSESCPEMARYLPPRGPVKANHLAAALVNRDASPFFAGRDNYEPARHGRHGRGGSFGSACRRVLGMTPGLLRTAVGAVDLTVVAAAANQHLNMARAHRKNRAAVSSIRCGQPVACGRTRRWLEYCPRIRARHGVGRGAKSDLAVKNKRRARLPIQAASYRLSLRPVSLVEMRLTCMKAYLRVLAYQKVAPRHAGTRPRCRRRAFDRLRALRNPRGAARLMPYFEDLGLPFIFQLYPGGGFQIDQPESDQKLRRVVLSDYCRKVIVTQSLSRDYIIDRIGCDPAKIELIFGGAFESRGEFDFHSDKKIFGRDNRLSISASLPTNMATTLF